jgi:DNA-binding NarL/FixJ family response regulator
MNPHKTMVARSSASTAKPAGVSQLVESSVKRKYTVALVEDQPDVRQSWARFINSFPDFSCICTCGNGEEALRVIPRERPDVVLMDIFLPRMSGIETTVRLKALLPQTQIVMLTVMADHELVFLALEAGADGYLLKRTKPSDLRTALLDVLDGGVPMTSQIARWVIGSFRQKAIVRDESVRLSIREEQIVLLLSQGYSNKQIAEKLELSIDTVRTHLKHVFNKLQVRSRTEAVVRYMTSKAPSQKPPDSP